VALILALLAGCGDHTSGRGGGAGAPGLDASAGSTGAVMDASVEAGPADASPESGADAQPHCAPGGPGLSDCGAAHESCCTSLPVTGGTYTRTYASDADGGATDGTDPATVSSFRLDKFDVTVGRFRQFVAALNGGWRPDPGAGKHTHLNGGLGLANNGADGGYEPGWVASDDGNLAPTDTNLATCLPFNTWTDAPGTQETLPIDCVNWWEAYAFCIWDGGFLPSEAEWEYAAAGGGEQRKYPWGSTDPGAGNQYAIYGDGVGDCYYPSGALAPCTGVSNIAPVGTTTLGAGRFGQLDLAGNMWQWNLDWHDTAYAPCTDCTNTVPTDSRVFRGGLFQYLELYLSPTSRLYGPPSVRNLYVGFRCARTP